MKQIIHRINNAIGKWLGMAHLFREMKKTRRGHKLLAKQVAELMELNCENSGKNWLDAFNEETK